jgi:predicted phage terminase large subunit-like protein
MSALRDGHANYVVSDEMAGLLGMTEEERQQVQALRRRGLSGLIPVTVKGSKQARARAVSGYIEAGDVHLAPAGAPWIPGFLDETAAFDNGAHDDQVDAMSQALARLTRGGPAKGSGAAQRATRANTGVPSGV